MKPALRFARWVLMISGGLLLVVLFTPLVPWTARLLSSPWTRVNQGVLIVLSGSTVSYGEARPAQLIGLNTYWRVMHAIYVWRSGHYRTILVSGAGTADTVKPLLMAYGIPESAILVENRAANTHENATFCKPLLATLPGPYVLLTSDYHMYRAARCFAREHIAIETMPAPDLLKRGEFPLQRWDGFCDLAAELTAIAYYRVHGWM